MVKLVEVSHDLREYGSGLWFRILIGLFFDFEEGEDFGGEFEVSFDRELIFFNLENVIKIHF